ncbi:uncharacterized protein EI97DRAFT_455579 [Westerdykella ornata]|uniref:Uncharacterized protein n=1 Tax=Westerdykella ornata TaxID=318751 RepID=A0A6A6JU09_WESOR|nr:uncharacterized protein EI97DRAFT_455579 [Westerdykella ornata]KAF2279318.1 hypothetical protein EI97DRAFT_455579 [Westerdykella ornata]
MRLRDATERRAPLAYQGNGSYIDLGLESNDDPGEPQSRSRRGTNVRTMAPPRGRRPDRVPSPPDEKQREMLLLLPAPFPTLDPGETLEDRVEASQHCIAMLILQRFGKDDEARVASYKDIDRRNARELQISATQLPDLGGPQSASDLIRHLERVLRNRFGIGARTIHFRDLYWSLRQKIIDEIVQEAMVCFPGGGFLAVKALLGVDDKELHDILDENADNTMKDDEKQERRRLQEKCRAHHLSRYKQGKDDSAIHLALPESSDQNEVIDPDFPHPGGLLVACIYLLENHLPISLLGEWKDLMLPQLLSESIRPFPCAVSGRNPSGSELKDRIEARDTPKDQQCNPPLRPSPTVRTSKEECSLLDRQVASGAPVEDVEIVGERLVNPGSKRAGEGQDHAADTPHILPSFQKNATHVEPRTKNEEHRLVGGLKSAASGDTLNQIGESASRTPPSFRRSSTGNQALNSSRKERTLPQASLIHPHMATTEDAPRDGQLGFPSRSSFRSHPQQQARDEPALDSNSPKSGPKVKCVTTPTVPGSIPTPSLSPYNTAKIPEKPMCSAASMPSVRTPEARANYRQMVTEHHRSALQQAQTRSSHQEQGHATSGSENGINAMECTPASNRSPAEPGKACPPGVSLLPNQGNQSVTRAMPHANIASYDRKRSPVQVAKADPQRLRAVRRAANPTTSDQSVSVQAISAYQGSSLSAMNEPVPLQGTAFPASRKYSPANSAGDFYQPRPSTIPSPQRKVQHPAGGWQTSSNRPIEYPSRGPGVSCVSCPADAAHGALMHFSSQGHFNGPGAGNGLSSTVHANLVDSGPPPHSNGASNHNYPDPQAHLFQEGPRPVHSLPDHGSPPAHLKSSGQYYGHAPSPQAPAATPSYAPSHILYTGNLHGGNVMNMATFPNWISHHARPTMAPVGGGKPHTNWSTALQDQHGYDMYPAFPRYTCNRPYPQPQEAVDESMMDPRLLDKNQLRGHESGNKLDVAPTPTTNSPVPHREVSAGSPAELNRVVGGCDGRQGKREAQKVAAGVRAGGRATRRRKIVQ